MLWPEFSCFLIPFWTFGKNPNNWNSFQCRKLCAWQLRREEAWNHICPPILCRCSQKAEKTEKTFHSRKKSEHFQSIACLLPGTFLSPLFLIALSRLLSTLLNCLTSAVDIILLLYISAPVSFPSFYLPLTDQSMWCCAFLICLKWDMPWFSGAIQW